MLVRFAALHLVDVTELQRECAADRGGPELANRVTNPCRDLQHLVALLVELLDGVCHPDALPGPPEQDLEQRGVIAGTPGDRQRLIGQCTPRGIVAVECPLEGKQGKEPRALDGFVIVHDLERGAEYVYTLLIEHAGSAHPTSVVGKRRTHESAGIAELASEVGCREQRLPKRAVTSLPLRLAQSSKAARSLAVVWCKRKEGKGLAVPTDGLRRRQRLQGVVSGGSCVANRAPRFLGTRGGEPVVRQLRRVRFRRSAVASLQDLGRRAVESRATRRPEILIERVLYERMAEAKASRCVANLCDKRCRSRCLQDFEHGILGSTADAGERVDVELHRGPTR